MSWMTKQRIPAVTVDNQKTILVDCDGVLLDWSTVFDQWMAARGFVQRPNAHNYYSIQDRFEDVDGPEAKKYTRLFNESAAIGFLPPLRDSVFWIKRLNEEWGYRFRVITSLSVDPYATKLRERNLHDLYGDVFDDILCLPTGDSKTAAIKAYRGTGLWWIEDKPANALLGLRHGLRPILLDHDHNDGFEHQGVVKVRTWKEIVDLVTTQSE